jgi:hypothetical protein
MASPGQNPPDVHEYPADKARQAGAIWPKPWRRIYFAVLFGGFLALIVILWLMR